MKERGKYTAVWKKRKEKRRRISTHAFEEKTPDKSERGGAPGGKTVRATRYSLSKIRRGGGGLFNGS